MKICSKKLKLKCKIKEYLKFSKLKKITQKFWRKKMKLSQI